MSRVAVVTGANKGIGFHIASQLSQSGLFSHVIIGCRDETRGLQAVQQIRNTLESTTTTTVSFLPLTIGDKNSHENFSKSIKEQYQKVDVLVNNAAIAFKGSDPTPFQGQCKPTLDINFHSTVDFTEKMLPLIRKGNDARIVNMASMAGRLGQLRSKELQDKFSDPSLTKEELIALVRKFETDVMEGKHAERGWGDSNYGLSKLAVIAMTKVWARDEAKYNVKVNCCCPGYCDTDMTSHKGSRPPSEGARNAVIPATMENCPTGEFFEDYQVSSW
jgi:carbonyl reductase 1